MASATDAVAYTCTSFALLQSLQSLLHPLRDTYLGRHKLSVRASTGASRTLHANLFAFPARQLSDTADGSDDRKLGHACACAKACLTGQQGFY